MKASELFFLCFGILSASFCHGSRFRASGPALTVTLKDPMVDSSSSGKWIDLAGLRPNLNWSVQSIAKPLPSLLPSLQALQGSVGYHYEQMRRAPSYVDGAAKFRFQGIDLDLQPSYEFPSRRSSLLVQVSRGSAFGLAKFTNTALEVIRGCYQQDFSSGSPVSAVRLTPTWDVLRRRGSCLIEGTTATQRTKAVLTVESQDPTLSIVHALSERHVIAPVIALKTGKIVYQWNVALESGSIQTKVDPTRAIDVTWMDRSLNGKWVTDFKLPLAGATLKALAADIRIRRQFSF